MMRAFSEDVRVLGVSAFFFARRLGAMAFFLGATVRLPFFA